MELWAVIAIDLVHLGRHQLSFSYTSLVFFTVARDLPCLIVDLVAPRHVALVPNLKGVKVHVVFQVLFLSEGFLAHLAFEVDLIVMGSHVPGSGKSRGIEPSATRIGALELGL